MIDHAPYMRQALAEAHQGMHLGEVPVGAVIVMGGVVVATGFNQPIHLQDPTAHAEIVALRAAARVVGNYRLTGATLYATVEPCLMCVGALVLARVSTLVYGTTEPKTGAVTSVLNLTEVSLNHRFEVVGGVLAAECSQVLVDFFKFRREEQ